MHTAQTCTRQINIKINIKVSSAVGNPASAIIISQSQIDKQEFSYFLFTLKTFSFISSFHSTIFGWVLNLLGETYFNFKHSHVHYLY